MTMNNLPLGVTVRKPGEPLPAGERPRNLLESAAMCDDLARVKGSLCEALWLSTDSKVAAANLSDPERWAKLSPPMRLMELGRWLNAECYEVMDLVEGPAVDTRMD